MNDAMRRVVTLPFGKTGIDFALKPKDELLVSRVNEIVPCDADTLVREAMESPFGGVSLRKMTEGKRSAVIIISDHTRPVPSRVILPHMLRELRIGNPDIDITLLVATGFHRPTTKEELRDKLGDKIYLSEKIVIHDARDKSRNTEIGILPSGAKLIIDKLAAETELLVAEGFIEPHFFAGYSGGRKSVLPGICDEKTVLGNHCGSFIASEFARTGILDGNPINRDMNAAARMAKLAYIVNVVINAEKKVIAAFAGDPFEAHSAGCGFLSSLCGVSPCEKGDIVITTNGGYPLDQNVYQSVKGLTAAEAAAKEGAVLIIASSCDDGSGGEGFYNALKNCESPSALEKKAASVPPGETEPDQWEYQIMARILAHHRVIFVSSPGAKDIITDMKLLNAETLDEALSKARALLEPLEPKGKEAHIVVIPDGVSVTVGSRR